MNDSIKEGINILITGYPLGIGKEYTGNKPVSRVGIVAQQPNSRTNTFLVDGSVSHGNSGSPVFDIITGKLLGIVSKFPTEQIQLFDENKNLVAMLPYNSSLTICVTAESILKLLP